MAIELDTQAADPRNLEALVRFIHEDAFSDNPHWRSCHCVFHYLSDHEGAAWSERRAEDNEATLRELVGSGEGHWIVAYHAGQMVGFVNADLRPALKRYDEWGVPVEADTGLVACFVVHPAWRRQGIATALLERAVASLSARGARRVDAFTVEDPETVARRKGDLGADQYAHHGPLPIYLRSGFRVMDRHDDLVHVRREVSS